MEKPFVGTGQNGSKYLMTVSELMRSVDDSPGARLAVVLFDKGILSPQEFLDIVIPGKDYIQPFVEGVT